MLKTVVAAVLPVTLFVLSGSEAGKSDLEAIKQTALDYGQGWYEGNAQRMERALHPDLAKRALMPDPRTGKGKIDHMSAMALVQARKAADAGEVPIGAVIMRGGEVVAMAHNLTRHLPDPTAHAEMLVIRAAAARLGSERLAGCDLYVTLEPCPMCAAAISAARIRRLYYGASDPKSGGVEHGPRIFASPSCHHRPEVYPDISASPAAVLLREFFAARR